MNKKLTILVAVAAAAAAVAIGLVLYVRSVQNNKPVTLDFAMNIGRYYLDGDKSQYYFEITDGKKIKLGGIDPLEFVNKYRSAEVAAEEGTASAEDEAAYFAKEHSYEIIRIPSSDSTYLILDWEDGMQGGNGMTVKSASELVLTDGVNLVWKE